jgi:uncharacterized protein
LCETTVTVTFFWSAAGCAFAKAVFLILVFGLLRGLSLRLSGCFHIVKVRMPLSASAKDAAMGFTSRILALDGGGIRGVIPAYLLQQLEAALGKPCYQCFDIIAGTSTGGLIALGLTTPAAAGKPPRAATDVLNIYLNDEDQIFVYQASGYFESKYYGTDTSTKPPSGIEPLLQTLFGSTTLAQAQQQLKALGNPMPKQVLTSCYTINGAAGISYAPYLFNWVDAAAGAADDYCVWEAARGTSAAPTYFPVANVGSGVANGSNATNRWVCDGGVTANNPALYALAQAFRLNLCGNLSDVLIVSLGTGLYDAGIKITDQGNWGSIGWVAGMDTDGYDTSPLINVLSMSNVLAPDQQLQLIMPSSNYFRLEPVVPYDESNLDGTDTQELLATAQAYIATGPPPGPGYQIFQNVVSALS